MLSLLNKDKNEEKDQNDLTYNQINLILKKKIKNNYHMKKRNVIKKRRKILLIINKNKKNENFSKSIEENKNEQNDNIQENEEENFNSGILYKYKSDDVKLCYYLFHHKVYNKIDLLSKDLKCHGAASLYKNEIIAIKAKYDLPKGGKSYFLKRNNIL